MQGIHSLWGWEGRETSPFRGDGVGLFELVRSLILANSAVGGTKSLEYKASLALLMMSAAEHTGSALCNKVRSSSK